MLCFRGYSSFLPFFFTISVLREIFAPFYQLEWVKKKLLYALWWHKWRIGIIHHPHTLSHAHYDRNSNLARCILMPVLHGWRWLCSKVRALRAPHHLHGAVKADSAVPDVVCRAFCRHACLLARFLPMKNNNNNNNNNNRHAPVPYKCIVYYANEEEGGGGGGGARLSTVYLTPRNINFNARCLWLIRCFSGIVESNRRRPELTPHTTFSARLCPSLSCYFCFFC